jgi:hypothetical protein
VQPLGRKSLFASFSSEKEDAETFKVALQCLDRIGSSAGFVKR